MTYTNDVSQPERWLTKTQIAEYFGFSTKWIDRRIKEGLPHAKFAGNKRFRISLCEAWLSNSGMPEMAGS